MIKRLLRPLGLLGALAVGFAIAYFGKDSIKPMIDKLTENFKTK